MALRAGRFGPAQVAASLRIERRKHQTPSSVIVLKCSRRSARPHLRHRAAHRGRQLRVIGVTRDAALIRLIEQSPHFTRATFFAPTTKAPSDPGERFHIEAQIEPVHGLRS